MQDSNYNVPQNGDDKNGTFAYMTCHQQYFAAMSMMFAFLPTRPDEKTYDKIFHQTLDDIYKWDVMPIQGEGGLDSQLGHEYPLHPDKGC